VVPVLEQPPGRHMRPMTTCLQEQQLLKGTSVSLVIIIYRKYTYGGKDIAFFLKRNFFASKKNKIRYHFPQLLHVN
jgi:hypothetical protein